MRIADLTGFAYSLHEVAPPLLAALIMRSWAGEKVREVKPNRGPMVDAINAVALGIGSNGSLGDAEPWCVRAVLAAWAMAGWATQQRLDPAISRSGSVFYFYHDTRKDFRLPATETPKIGDALIRYEVVDPSKPLTRKNTRSTHTELILGVHKDGTLETVGGNTGSTVQRDGDGVYIHRGVYRLGQPNIQGFVRPAFIPINAEEGL